MIAWFKESEETFATGWESECAGAETQVSVAIWIAQSQSNKPIMKVENQRADPSRVHRTSNASIPTQCPQNQTVRATLDRLREVWIGSVWLHRSLCICLFHY